jgi:hypothetical protein
MSTKGRRRTGLEKLSIVDLSFETETSHRGREVFRVVPFVPVASSLKLIQTEPR